MNRRAVLLASCAWPALGLRAQEAQRPHLDISRRELQARLSERFPLRAGVEGLVDLRIDAARLLLLPDRQLVGATLLARLDSSQLGRSEGEIDVAFSLRYAAGDRTLRARDPTILSLRWPGLPADVALQLQLLLPQLARNAMGEVVLYRFSQRDLALADTMGFQPEQIVVRDDGLFIGFGPKPAS